MAFRQVFVSSKRSNPKADAEAMLPRLVASALMLGDGDPLLLPETFGPTPLSQIDAQFGEGFASELGKVAPGHWAGPLKSAYGFHLVLVTSERSRRSSRSSTMFAMRFSGNGSLPDGNRGRRAIPETSRPLSRADRRPGLDPRGTMKLASTILLVLADFLPSSVRARSSARLSGAPRDRAGRVLDVMEGASARRLSPRHRAGLSAVLRQLGEPITTLADNASIERGRIRCDSPWREREFSFAIWKRRRPTFWQGSRRPMVRSRPNG